ncbi:MAG: biotin/lipoyl-binding protein, partial [Actinomycetota bacterium]|nr:biotin/lipoyl-binding protein [Actinomycetota bacterium]
MELAAVTSGTVHQTVAAPATVEPADRRAVTAPASGHVAELLVADGEVVEAGRPVLRLDSDHVDSALAQARAGVDAAAALAGVVPTVDLSPLMAGVRHQLDAVVPGLLDTLEQQAATVPDDEARAALLARLADARAAYQRAARELA